MRRHGRGIGRGRVGRTPVDHPNSAQGEVKRENLAKSGHLISPDPKNREINYTIQEVVDILKSQSDKE